MPGKVREEVQEKARQEKVAAGRSEAEKRHEKMECRAGGKISLIADRAWRPAWPRRDRRRPNFAAILLAAMLLVTMLLITSHL
jgi:hypothetical protein